MRAVLACLRRHAPGRARRIDLRGRGRRARHPRAAPLAGHEGDHASAFGEGRIENATSKPVLLQQVGEVLVGGGLRQPDGHIDVGSQRAAPCRIAACAPNRYQSRRAFSNAAARSASSSATGEGMRGAIEPRSQRKMIPQIGITPLAGGKVWLNPANVCQQRLDAVPERFRILAIQPGPIVGLRTRRAVPVA